MIKEHLLTVIDDLLVPLHLLIYSMQTAMTTLTCIVEYLSWNVDAKVKLDLGTLYGPYLVLCESLSCQFPSSCLRTFNLLQVAVFMGLDMFGRLKRTILGKSIGQKSLGLRQSKKEL